MKKKIIQHKISWTWIYILVSKALFLIYRGKLSAKFEILITSGCSVLASYKNSYEIRNESK